MEEVKFGYWENYGEDGRKKCHEIEPVWWSRPSKAAKRAGLGYCGFDRSNPHGGDYAWSRVFDTYEEAFVFYQGGLAAAEAADDDEDDEGGLTTKDVEDAIRAAAKGKYGTVLGLVHAVETEYRIAIVEDDPEYAGYPALTISAFPTDTGIVFDKSDYYLTIRAALEQLDVWEAAERERIALMHRPMNKRQGQA